MNKPMSVIAKQHGVGIRSHKDQSLKIEKMYTWVHKYWMPLLEENANASIYTTEGRSILNHKTIERMYGRSMLGYKFVGFDNMNVYVSEPCDAVINIQSLKDLKPNTFSGSYVMRFEYVGLTEEDELSPDFDQYKQAFENFWKEMDPPETVLIPILSTTFREADGSSWTWYTTTVVVLPHYFVLTWAGFESEFSRITNAFDSEGKVFVVGGKIASFVPKVGWDSIVLPQQLRDDLISDVNNFFNKGVSVYKKLGLKPFRKLLLAGPPGTGKTMIATAIAKQALEDGLVVIYISSAHRNQDDKHASTFSKIEQALEMAANSAVKTIIILEEFDAYLHDDEKAMILNVLDGNESPLNDHGTLLIATTNYPEAIDERIMKRPGRMDRIFIIPEVKRNIDAEKILKKYLGDMWQPSHSNLIPSLVFYSPAFIREVAILALTRCACNDLEVLDLDVLTESFTSLKDQIEARDSFLSGRPEFSGLTGSSKKGSDGYINGDSSSKKGLPM